MQRAPTTLTGGRWPVIGAGAHQRVGLGVTQRRNNSAFLLPSSPKSDTILGEVAMYISLDRLDIELSPRRGRARVLQTDHRSAVDLSAQSALSQLAILVRCLNPRREPRELDLFYIFADEPPPAIRRAVTIGGGHVLVGDFASVVETDVVPLEPDQAEVDRLANSAFEELAALLIAKNAATDAFGCLIAEEQRLAADGFPEETDESTFWPLVLELGALTARALLPTNGGSWSFDATANGTLPFVYRCSFRGELATVNPLGKALKLLRAKGDGEEPSVLVRMLAASP